MQMVQAKRFTKDKTVVITQEVLLWLGLFLKEHHHQ